MMRRCIVLLAALGVGACDIPTDAPRWDQQWQVPVPVDSLEVSVDELLPASVRMSEDGSSFVATVPGMTARFSLAAMCGVCAGLSGFAPVKPEFGDTLHTSSTLPADLVSATLTGGSVGLQLSHTFDFDPLRPSSDPAAERGWLVVHVTSAGNVVAHDSISGDDRAFPSGVTLEPTLAIQPVDVANDLQIELRIYSPEGDGTTIGATDEIVLRLEPTDVSISEATVSLPDQTVGPETRTVDLPIDSVVIDQIQEGALLVDVENPFDVTGSVSITFELTGSDVVKTVPLGTGSYAERIAFSGQELQDILAQQEVDVVVTGDVGTAGGTVTVRPGQRIAFDLELEVILMIGSSEEGI